MHVARAVVTGLACVLALVPCALGCEPSATELPAAEAVTATAPEVRESRYLGGFVVIRLMIPPEPWGPKAAVINPIVPEAELLARGIVVVRFHNDWRRLSPPAPPPPPAPHEEPAGDAALPEPPRPAAPSPTRVGSWMLASERPGIVGRSYFKLVHDTATYLPVVLDHLESLPEVDARRIGIAGGSSSGFAALEALMLEPRLAAAVVGVACGDYRDFLRRSSLALADDPRWLVEGELPLDADYAAELASREPIASPGRFPPRALLMLNGALDPAIPASCARSTAEALARAYAERGLSDRFRAVLYEDAGHNLGRRAIDEALAWWERWLLGGPPGGEPPLAASARPPTAPAAP